jgi:hypothetical protein
MLWTQIRSWAKSHGYEVLKDKGDETKDEKVQYYWSKSDDPKASGVSPSVSKLARDIYNNITDNIWVDYQKEFQKNKEEVKFSTSDYK